MSENRRKEPTREQIEQINQINSLLDDVKSEARKWTEILARSLVLLNAGAAVAVLAFLGTAELSGYGLAAVTLFLFAAGGFLPPLTALGNVYDAQWHDEQLTDQRGGLMLPEWGCTPPRPGTE